MKKILLSAIIVAMALPAIAQQPAADKPQKVKITPYGFVRNYFNYDSRKTYTVIGGEYNMIPYDEKWNGSEEECTLAGVERYDENANPTAQFLSITTRFGLNLEGPSVLGAATSGKIEADFGGTGDYYPILRLRHAYFKLNWKDAENPVAQELIAGQTWHPLCGEIPECLGMAVGAPFRAHSRTPQLRYNFYDGILGFSVAAMYQTQYKYNGPKDNVGGSEASTRFANNAIIPELYVGLNLKSDHVFAILGCTYQTLRPRVSGLCNSKTVAVDDKLTSFTPTAYFQYSKDLFSVKYRTMLAQNTSHVNQINGYGVTGVNADGSWDYEPIKATISYIDFAYGKKYRANLFLGYQQNLGASHDLYDFSGTGAGQYYIYMKGGTNFTHLHNIFRVAPSISYNLKHFNFGIEYEYTACKYGDLDKNGAILDNDNLHQVANHRVCVLMKYSF